MNTENQEEFDEWLVQYKGLVLKVIRAYARTPHDQEDLFQEVAFQLWKSIPSYKNEVAETTWIYRVSMYTAIGWARKEGTRKRRSHSLNGDEHLLLESTKPADKRLEWLYEKITQLNELERSLTVMMLDGCSYKEMAAVLGITESHVGVKINRIKKYLNKRLKEVKNDEL